MIQVDCFFCDRELTEPGGILLGPPNTLGLCEKAHICVDCYDEIDIKRAYLHNDPMTPVDSIISRSLPDSKETK